MFRRIMIPLDGSRFGEWALPPAVALAKATGAALELVAVHTPFMLTPTPDGSGFELGTEEAALKALQSQVDTAASRVAAAAAGVSIQTSVRCGTVREELLAHAAETNPDLIVMTTHGRGPLRRMWLGSVADGMIRHAAEPVLLVRPVEGKEADPAAGMLFEHVLVPLDGSGNSEEILPAATAMADLGAAAVTLVRMVQPPLAVSPAYYTVSSGTEDALLAGLRGAAETYLDGVAERLRRPSRTITTRVRLETSIVHGILDEAEQTGADLVALATHGHGPAGRFLLGNVADKVVRSASVPVLVYRPRGR